MQQSESYREERDILAARTAETRHFSSQETAPTICTKIAWRISSWNYTWNL